MPRPRSIIHLKQIDHGAMFKGTKGYVIADFASRILLPFGDNPDMTDHKPPTQDKVLPPLGRFQKQWLNACKNPSRKTACDFEYSGDMIEQLVLGLAAYRAAGRSSMTAPPAAQPTAPRQTSSWDASTARAGRWTASPHFARSAAGGQGVAGPQQPHAGRDRLRPRGGDRVSPVDLAEPSEEASGGPAGAGG